MSISSSESTSEEENIEDDINPKKSSGQSSQEILGNGDTEIFSTLIPMMENLEALKTCRLVCKSWNEFACRALRKLPWVYYPIDETRDENLVERLQLFIHNTSLGLPSPFGNLEICAGTFSEQSFLKFLKYVLENPNSFSIHLHIRPHCANTDPKVLRTVLTLNQHNFRITKLFIYRDTLIRDIFQAEEIRLPYLKLLAIGNDRFISDSILGICGNLCLFSPLESLQIGGSTTGEKLRKVMLPGGCQSVQNLSLKFIRINSEDCKYVCERVKEIPCIKRLQLYLRQLDNYNYNCANYPGFEAVIEHFADSLECLTGDCLPIFKTTNFPKLRQINFTDFRNFDSEFSFPVERYPLLRRATFVVENFQKLDYPCVEEQSLGIEELSLKFSEVRVLEDCPDEILTFISAAGMVFPNVSFFSIVQSGGEQSFTSALLSVICKSFPRLTSLELWVDIRDPAILSGLTVDVNKWLSKGWPLEKIPREASLLDFPGLKKLSLGPGVVTTEHLFTYCLSKMRKLQYLTYHSGENMIPAEKIRDSIGHLRRITIVTERFRVVETKRLSVMLPSIVEMKKVVHKKWLGFIEILND